MYQISSTNAPQKVCRILKILSNPESLRLADIAAGAEISAPTTLRILDTLIDEGFVRRDPANAKRYLLGDQALLLGELAAMDRIAAVRILLTDQAQTSIETREKSLRSKDGSFAGLLLIEGLDETSVRNALWRLRALLPELDAGAIEKLPLYAVFFNLHKRLLPAG